MSATLILLRHGQSSWNLENRFTGWIDVDLSDTGREEATKAGQLLKAEGLKFDQCFTSVLKRAIRTLWISLDQLDQMWVPVTRAWQLNERHYGALQGLNKAETVERHGEAQVKQWRRGFAVQPPALDANDEMHPRFDRRYATIPAKSLPATESLADCIARAWPYYQQNIEPLLKAGKTVLVAAHGNSLRGLVKQLDGLSEEEVIELNIPTGIPLAYRFDDSMKIVSKGYLGDPEAAKAAAEAVARQTQGKKS
jgi:2,3-bisphosphoglycerate-dependent phosphoglycerate mutase